MATRSAPVSQCQKPRGWLGRFVLWRMNARHSKVTDWGLAHIAIEKHHTILDVRCGGGKTVSKLAATATQGKVYGIDYSEESVAASKRTNARWMDMGRVEVRHGSVSQLPFPDGMFDLVTAVETHFWWPALPADMREIFRVLKPGGKLIIIAEIYKGANTTVAKHSAGAILVYGVATPSSTTEGSFVVDHCCSAKKSSRFKVYHHCDVRMWSCR